MTTETAERLVHMMRASAEKAERTVAEMMAEPPARREQFVLGFQDGWRSCALHFANLIGIAEAAAEGRTR